MLPEPYYTRVQELVIDLRSGNWRQSTGRLRRDYFNPETQKIDGGSFCCLGVACEVALRHGQGARVENRYFPTINTFNSEGSSGTSLPGSIADWFGFIVGDPQITILCGQIRDGYQERRCHDCRISRADNCTNTVDVAATTANDDLYLTFDQIADGFARRYLGGVDATPEN